MSRSQTTEATVGSTRLSGEMQKRKKNAEQEKATDVAAATAIVKAEEEAVAVKAEDETEVPDTTRTTLPQTQEPFSSDWDWIHSGQHDTITTARSQVFHSLG